MITHNLYIGIHLYRFSGKESACQWRRHNRHGFDTWVGKIHWKRKWQPTPEFLLENPRDGGAWWAAVYGGTQSQTRLKWLSSSSSIRMAPWQTSLIVTFSTLKPTDSPGRASLMVHSKGLDFICITAWSQVTTMLGVENSSLHGDSTSSINFIDVLEGQTEGLVSRISW